MKEEINSFDSKNKTPITSVSEPMIAYNIPPSPLQILANILGLDTLSVTLKNTLDLLALAEKGFPVKVIKKLQKHTRFTNREMGKVLDMSESTLQRRLREKQNLDKRQSESAVQLASVWAKGIEVFEDEDQFRNWLHTENKALGGNKPIAILNSSIGREEIKEVLSRIEWGVYS